MLGNGDVVLGVTSLLHSLFKHTGPCERVRWYGRRQRGARTSIRTCPRRPRRSTSLGLPRSSSELGVEPRWIVQLGIKPVHVGHCYNSAPRSGGRRAPRVTGCACLIRLCGERLWRWDIGQSNLWTGATQYQSTYRGPDVLRVTAVGLRAKQLALDPAERSRSKLTPLSGSNESEPILTNRSARRGDLDGTRQLANTLLAR